MKQNHIPVTERLKNRINKLSHELGGAMIKKKGRFYQACRACDRSIIDVSMEGHLSYCKYKGMDKQISYYRKLLAEAQEIKS